MRSILVFFLLGYFFSSTVMAQSCDSLGQMPNTAFPICGTTAFFQKNVPICKTDDLPVPGCTNNQTTNYANKNPFWYKFKCYQSGSLGFTITPINSSDDYDWQLFDITGHLPTDVFQDGSLVVAGNWSGSYGATGASSTGANFIQCASSPSANAPTFSSLPFIIQGHEYLLLVSHYSNSQSGYSLTFKEGAKNITDTTPPKLLQANVEQCKSKSITIKLSKEVKCSSLTKQGIIEFSLIPVGPISGTIPNILSVTGNGCSNGFDFNSITINLDTILPVGYYKLRVKKGADGNTLLDYCDNAIRENEEIGPFYSAKRMKADFNYTIKYGCKFDTVLCNVIDTSGIQNYKWSLDNQLMPNLNSPTPQLIYSVFGNKEIKLEATNQYGCSEISIKNLYLFNTLKANFEASQLICPNDSAIIQNLSIGDSIIQYNWDFGLGNTLTETNPTRHIQFYPSNTTGNYIIPLKLSITNKIGCSSRVSKNINILSNCYIDVPNAFTPNLDGINDYLYPLNAYNAANLKFAVYNRYGQRVFYTENWTKKWDGNYNNIAMEQGTYVWFLNYFDTQKKQWINRKGTTLLLR